jgi:undecaprenyl-phosphate galactose phosphotransferase/putative colanic acid biosynthesis UDP-glucose lipid carrier transferase
VSARGILESERSVPLPPVGAPVRHLDVSTENAASFLALTLDALLILATSVVTGAAYQTLAFGAIVDPSSLASTGAIVAAVFCAITKLRASEPLRVLSGYERARSAVTSWILTFLLLALAAFSLKISAHFSRGMFFSFFAAGFLVVVPSRVWTPRLLARVASAQAYRGIEPIIIAPVGSADAARLAAEFRRRSCATVHFVDFEAHRDSQAWDMERRRLIERTRTIARAASRGGIHIVAPDLDQERLSGVVSALRLVPRAIAIVPPSGVEQLLRYAVRAVGNSLELEVQKEPLSPAQRVAKRAIDMIVAAAAIVVLAPVLLAIALLIKLSSAGPAFFRQTRNGIGGKPFQILKFRTMHVMENGQTIRQACAKDTRVTRVGAFLRRSSLDELPQLFNVLRGEMSLVGPRPHATAHDVFYAEQIDNYEIRQHVKPGLTGWAQVNGYRGETPTLDLMYRRIEFDLWYASNATVSLDLLIMLRTIPALFGQHNAY